MKELKLRQQQNLSFLNSATAAKERILSMQLHFAAAKKHTCARQAHYLKKGFFYNQHINHVQYQIIKVQQHMQTCERRMLRIFPFFQAKEDNETLRETSEDYILKLDKTTIIHKIFETNSSFHVKQRYMGKVQLLFFKRFLLVLTKFSGGGLSTR